MDQMIGIIPRKLRFSPHFDTSHTLKNNCALSPQFLHKLESLYHILLILNTSEQNTERACILDPLSAALPSVGKYWMGGIANG
jgi:hypothetical protein